MITRPRFIRSLLVVAVASLGVYLAVPFFVPLEAQVGQALPMVPAEVQLFGGPGDQVGQSIAITSAGSIAVGSDAGDLIHYPIPLGPPISRSRTSGTSLLGLAASGTELAVAGYAIPPACGATDSVGGVENKSMAARFDSTSVGPLACNSRTLARYSGHEAYTAAAWNDGNLYMTGGADTCGWGDYSFVLSRLRPGKTPASVAEPGVDLAGFTCLGASSGTGLVALNGRLYIGGYSRLASEDDHFRPVLMKYKPNLARIWKRRPADVAGAFHAVTTMGAEIVAVGYAVVDGRIVYLIEKYRENGTRVWSRTSAGVAEGQLNGVVSVGSRLFAVGAITSAGSGGSDAVILEVDPATGATTSTTLWGGNLDDSAFAAATDGNNNLFVVGASRSFASPDGNLVGQNDGVLLRFPLSAKTTAVTLTTSPSGLSIVVDGRSVTSPTVEHWEPGSPHTVEVPTPQLSGDDSRFVFGSWSDGGARAHTVTAPAAPTTLVAAFREQHRLALAVSPSGGGSATASPSSSDAFYDSGSVVSIAAVPASGYQFAGFSGDLAGATSPQSLDMNGPRRVTADFAACGFMLSPTSLSVSPGDSTALLSVSTATRCYWSVTSGAPWVSITSGASGTGPGSLSLSIAANTTGSPRNGLITVAGVTLSISQPACSYSATPTTVSFQAGGGTATVSVAAGTGCPWTAQSHASWLSITSGGSGTGNGTVRFNGTASSVPAARSGTLTVAGRTVVVTQDGKDPDACGAADVSARVGVSRSAFTGVPPLFNLVAQDIRITNTSSQPIPGPLFLAMDGLPRYDSGTCQYGCGVIPAPPLTYCGSASGSSLVQFTSGTLDPGRSVTLRLNFAPASGSWSRSFAYSTRVVSGRPSK